MAVKGQEERNIESGAARSLEGVSLDDAELRRLLGQLFDSNIRFPNRPVFVPDLDIFEMPDGLGFQFRGTEAPVVLRGQAAATVVQCLRNRLDGRTTIEELARQPPSGVSHAAYVRTLLLLHSKGLLTSETGERRPEPQIPDEGTLNRQLLYWGRHLGITRSADSSSEVQRRIETAQLIVIGTGALGAVTCDLLARTGVRRIQAMAWNDDGAMQRAAELSSAPFVDFCQLPTTSLDSLLLTLRAWLDHADLLITATRDASTALFEAVNELCLLKRTPWLYGNADGSALDIGPLVQPYETGCFACLELRRRSARELAFESAFYEERLAVERAATDRIFVGEAIWPDTLGASLIVGEACRFITGIAPPQLTEKMLRVLPVSGTMEENRFSRVPRCPACYRGIIPAAELAR